jgi:hypothetical protein
VGAEGPSGLRLLRLDARGEPTGGARWIPASAGWQVTSNTLGCSTNGCRGEMSASAGAVDRLDAFTFAVDEAGSSRGPALAAEPLALLGGGSGQDPFLSAGDPALGSLYLLGVKPGEGTRVRRLTLAW